MRNIAIVILVVLLSDTCFSGEVADRMAAGIENWKKNGAHGKWWSCGDVQENSEDISRELAEYITENAEKNGINPWGLAGTIAKESAFDECAFGKKSRDWAYKNGMLTPNRLTISHHREDVLNVIASKSWRREIGKADMGLPQLMYPTVYKGDPSILMQRKSGIEIAAAEMAKRAMRVGAYVKVALSRPWGTWPGRYKEKYDKSVVSYARALGATKDDISGVKR